MIGDIVRHLRSANVELKLECSRTIFRCSIDRIARRQIRHARGLEPLVAIIKNGDLREDKALIAAASGAIWKCAASDANVKVLSGVRHKIVGVANHNA